MGIDATWPLQRAVINNISNYKPVLEVLGDDISHLDSHKVEKMPALRIGHSRTQAWASATFDGQEHEITLDLWTKEGASSESKRISHEIINLLHNADFDVEGHALVDMQFECSEVYYRKDKDAYHCHMVFRALTVSD